MRFALFYIVCMMLYRLEPCSKELFCPWQCFVPLNFSGSCCILNFENLVEVQCSVSSLLRRILRSLICGFVGFSEELFDIAHCD